MERIVQCLLERKFLFLSIFLGIGILVLGTLYFTEANASEAFVCPSKVGESLEEEKKMEEDVKSTIHVDIKGAVKQPGVYLMEPGSVVNDLIQLAGGLTKDADTTNVNLSKILEDEMVIVIYTKEEMKELLKDTNELYSDATITDHIEKKESIIKGESSKKDTSVLEGKISLNTATLEELITLPGIGEAKAKSIIEYRKTCGAFEKIEDIKNISGIGDAVYAKLKEYITV